MKQCINEVEVVGVLKSIDAEEKKGENGNYISGKIVFEVNNHGELQEIPVSVYSNQLTKNKTPNKAFDNLKDLIENGVSMAAVNGDRSRADMYSFKKGALQTSIFPNRAGDMVSSTQISNNFFNKVFSRSRAVEKAVFTCELVIKEMLMNEDDDVMTLSGVIMQYGDKADIVKFTVRDPEAIDHIRSHWNGGDTVMVRGDVIATVRTGERKDPHSGSFGFGANHAAEAETYTYTVIEYLINEGSEMGYSDEAAYDIEEVIKAVETTRTNAEAKAKNRNGGTNNTAAQATRRNRGF